MGYKMALGERGEIGWQKKRGKNNAPEWKKQGEGITIHGKIIETLLKTL